MAQMGRPDLSVQQKKELWFRRKQGQSLSEIGLALGKAPGSVHGVLASNGGVTPDVRTRAPSAVRGDLVLQSGSSVTYRLGGFEQGSGIGILQL